jgi:acyl-CoA synthetase (AMP-forming)/AMP-acid ligase II
MIVNELLIKIKNYSDKDAMIWQDKKYSYEEINELIENYSLVIAAKGMPGDTVAIVGDYSPHTIAFMIALLQYNCVVLPLTNSSDIIIYQYCDIAEAEHIIRFDNDGNLMYESIVMPQSNEIMHSFKGKKHPGLVIFSSGSTGVSKAILHDAIPLLEKFRVSRKCVRIISFLLFDHIGGINTLFYTLFNGGCVVIPKDRSVMAVCQAIDLYKVEALTTTPTFLNLLLLSQATDHYCLDSLRVINYGTEIMPENTLFKLHELLPNTRLSQAYGLSEVGVLPVRSVSSTSTLMVIDETKDFNVRVRDGMLEIKAHSSMIGYLNCFNPISRDGWFKTGDLVEVLDGRIRILGRQSDIINVGGAKVYPAEVENVLQQMDSVEDVLVFAMPNSITGNTVVAKLRLSVPEETSIFQIRMRTFCKDKLSNYKIPQKIQLTNEIFYGDRYKKIRKVGSK